MSAIFQCHCNTPVSPADTQGCSWGQAVPSHSSCWAGRAPQAQGWLLALCRESSWDAAGVPPNLVLPERNFFLLEAELNHAWDVAWVCNLCFFPQEQPLCSLLLSFRRWHPFQVTLQLLGKVFGRLCLCHSSHSERFWVSLMVCIPDLFIRKIENREAPNPSTPEIKSGHGDRGQRDKWCPPGKGDAGGLSQ